MRTFASARNAAPSPSRGREHGAAVTDEVDELQVAWISAWRAAPLEVRATLHLPLRKGRLLAKRSSGFAKGEMARLELKIRGAPPEGRWHPEGMTDEVDELQAT